MNESVFFCTFIKSYDLIEKLNLKLLEDDSLHLVLLSLFVCSLVSKGLEFNLAYGSLCFFLICLFAKVIDKNQRLDLLS